MEVTVNGKADVWRRRIDDQRASGQSVRGWCLANEVREHSFYWWRVRLGLSPVKAKPSNAAKRSMVRARGCKALTGVERQALVTTKTTTQAPTFARVVVDSLATKAKPAKVAVTEAFCLRLAGGRELILPASMAMTQVAELLCELERRS